jgi:transposase IS66 family protein
MRSHGPVLSAAVGAGKESVLPRWKGLTLFLDDGRIEIDSNVVERTIPPIALNRA